MSLHVTLRLPPDVEELVRRKVGNLDVEVTEAFAAELFRDGRVTHAQLAAILGLDRHETDAWLKRRGLYEGSPSMDDLDADRETLNRLFSKGA